MTQANLDASTLPVIEIPGSAQLTTLDKLTEAQRTQINGLLANNPDQAGHSLADIVEDENASSVAVCTFEQEGAIQGAIVLGENTRFSGKREGDRILQVMAECVDSCVSDGNIVPVLTKLFETTLQQAPTSFPAQPGGQVVLLEGVNIDPSEIPSKDPLFGQLLQVTGQPGANTDRVTPRVKQALEMALSKAGWNGDTSRFRVQRGFANLIPDQAQGDQGGVEWSLSYRVGDLMVDGRFVAPGDPEEAEPLYGADKHEAICAALAQVKNSTGLNFGDTLVAKQRFLVAKDVA